MQTRIPCVIMRGGTSRGPFFLTSDLPADVSTRDAVLLSVMGSPHEIQVDGIGGSHSVTSKVAMISRSKRPDADVDYLFAQVNVRERFVDTSPNCGNMLAGVGPFALEAGLVPADDRVSTVRIYNVATLIYPCGFLECLFDFRFSSHHIHRQELKYIFSNFICGRKPISK